MFKELQKFDLPNLDLIRLPEISLTQKEIAAVSKNTTTNTQFFKELVNEGWIKYRVKVDKQKWPEYIARIREEVSLFEELGFIDYNLLVWRTINKARELGAFIDAGRGSVCNSLVYFLIGVTGVDSHKHDLMFARFMSKVRSRKEIKNGVTYIQGSLAPDVDLNLGGVRGRIISWLKEIYPNRVAKIAALSTFTGKDLITECCKAIAEYTPDQAKEISDMIERHFGIVEDIEDVYKNNEKFKFWVDSTNRTKLTYKICLKLRDLITGKTTHASGYYLSYDPLDDSIPTELTKKGELTISYDKTMSAELGTKLDLLGLDTNKIIKAVLDQISETEDDFELEQNPDIYTRYQDGKLLPYGLYQIGASCAYRVCNDIKPANINELSDVSAIARPGALAYLKDYVNHATEPPHEIFEEILKPTRYRALYQEQLMKMMVKIGFTADEAEVCRKIIGKKLVEKVKDWEKKIYDKVAEKGLPIIVSESIWKILNDSAKYSFNAGHSLGTAYTAALTTLLKYKYPLEFYCACLQALLADIDEEEDEESKGKGNKQERIAIIQKELATLGHTLLPPSLLKSDFGFKIEDNNIRFALGAIKGIEKATLDKLVNFRKEYSSKIEMFLAAKEAGIGIGVLSSLIQSGAMDNFQESGRSKLVLELQTWNILTPREKVFIKQLFETGEHGTSILSIIKKCVEEIKDEKGKPLIKESRFNTIKRDYEKYKLIYQQNSKNENLAAFWYEYKNLGLSYSQKLADIYQQSHPDIQSIAQVNEENEGEYVLFVGIVQEVYNRRAKNGNPYVRMVITDQDSSITALIFSGGKENGIEKCKDNNDGKLPKEDDIVLISGKKTKDAVFVSDLGIQSNKIYMKLQDLKDKKSKKEEKERVVDAMLNIMENTKCDPYND